MDDNKPRCEWAQNTSKLSRHYHDNEWGVPVHDDRKHFEMLCLEGAQAGLSWEIILKKREAYKKYFKNFEPKEVAKISDEELESLSNNPEIIRNKRKIFAIRNNSVIFLKIQEEFGSFDKYIWGFVQNKQIVNRPENYKDITGDIKEAKEISKDLKKRGMSFVGPTIIYAYMEAVGIVDDHTKNCYIANLTKV